MKKKYLLLPAIALLWSCKKHDTPVASEIDKIVGQYSGVDSSATVQTVVHYDGSSTATPNISKGNRAVIVTKISDSEFNINLDSSLFSSNILFTGFVYQLISSKGTGVEKKRTIQFFPDNDSIAITEDFSFGGYPPEYHDGETKDGLFVKHYGSFNGKK